MEERLTLKQIRENKGVTQKHIYNLLGISRQTLINKETGRTKFTALEVQKLCDEFGVSINEIRL